MMMVCIFFFCSFTPQIQSAAAVESPAPDSIMGCCVAVPQDKVAIIERFGKFERIAQPGLAILPLPGIWTVSGTLSKRLQQIFVPVETKTKDNVFVRVTVAVQFHVLDNEKSQYDAYYKLSTPSHQITAYVEDVVRRAVPSIELDNIFVEKGHIAHNIFLGLEEDMKSFGYKIVATLVTDISPDAKVKFEMNEINVNRRMRVANTEKAEAAKIVRIKNAEAQADATFLQGEGIARQRRAIVDGMKSSMDLFANDVAGFNKKNVMQLMLITQYFDTLKDISKGKESKIIFSPKRKSELPQKHF